ncbi:MAG: type II toxin-antitoxin system RelB/DinJ family antitoxin [Synergistaceae bacterium]|nr:type II toxin-antitoxin system RelB/DinJ family antitoxin [Synergistaceae bacterium]
MPDVSINIVMDENLRNSFSDFCTEIGLSMSSAISVFARQAVRLQRIPFEISADPFYSEENICRLERAANDVRTGRAQLTVHELIDTD